MLFLMKKDNSSAWQKYYYFISIIFFAVILISCDTNNNPEKTRENKITKQKAAKTVAQSDRNKLLLQKEEIKKNAPENTADEKILTKKVEQFRESVVEKEIAEDSIEDFLKSLGPLDSLTSSQLLLIAQKLSVVSEEDYNLFVNIINRTFQPYEMDKEDVIKYAKNIMNVAKLVTDPIRANHLFMKAANVQEFFIDYKIGRDTNKFILERMDSGLGYDRGKYMYTIRSVAESYAKDGDFKKVETEFSNIFKKFPDMTSMEKDGIEFSIASKYISKNAPLKYKKIGFEMIKSIANSSSSQKSTAEYVYNLLLQKIEDGSWSYTK